MASIRQTSLLILAYLLVAVPVGAAGQESTVHGTVLYNPTLPDCMQLDPCTADLALTRPEDWRPPQSAVNVVVRGTHHVVKTNRDGSYEIRVPSPNASLMFLAIGHNRIEVPVEGRSRVDVRLTPTPLPVIQTLLSLIMPEMVAGRVPDIDRLAAESGVNRETARDILWLVIGDRRMAEHYPDELIPDYRFDDERPDTVGGQP